MRWDGAPDQVLKKEIIKLVKLPEMLTGWMTGSKWAAQQLEPARL